LLTYEDGSTLLLAVKLGQGIHRVNDFKHGSNKLITHEIFIAEAEINDEPIGEFQAG